MQLALLVLKVLVPYNMNHCNHVFVDISPPPLKKAHTKKRKEKKDKLYLLWCLRTVYNNLQHAANRSIEKCRSTTLKSLLPSRSEISLSNIKEEWDEMEASESLIWWKSWKSAAGIRKDWATCQGFIWKRACFPKILMSTSMHIRMTDPESGLVLPLSCINLWNIKGFCKCRIMLNKPASMLWMCSFTTSKCLRPEKKANR